MMDRRAEIHDRIVANIDFVLAGYEKRRDAANGVVRKPKRRKARAA